jgi:hypothetical protein
MGIGVEDIHQPSNPQSEIRNPQWEAEDRRRRPWRPWETWRLLELLQAEGATMEEAAETMGRSVEAVRIHRDRLLSGTASCPSGAEGLLAAMRKRFTRIPEARGGRSAGAAEQAAQYASLSRRLEGLSEQAVEARCYRLFKLALGVVRGDFSGRLVVDLFGPEVALAVQRLAADLRADQGKAGRGVSITGGGQTTRHCPPVDRSEVRLEGDDGRPLGTLSGAQCTDAEHGGVETINSATAAALPGPADPPRPSVRRDVG